MSVRFCGRFRCETKSLPATDKTHVPEPRNFLSSRRPRTRLGSARALFTRVGARSAPDIESRVLSCARGRLNDARTRAEGPELAESNHRRFVDGLCPIQSAGTSVVFLNNCRLVTTPGSPQFAAFEAKLGGVRPGRKADVSVLEPPVAGAGGGAGDDRGFDARRPRPGPGRESGLGESHRQG